MANQFTCFWRNHSVVRQFTTAVSLHGHTNRSKESLYFIREFANKCAPLRFVLSQITKKPRGLASIKIDLCRAYWTPPLPPLQAFTVERKQIEEGLGMQSLISLTDHDNIEAPLLLRVVPEARRIPVSLEWSVPFSGTVFHFGVHNLPTSEATLWLQRMMDYKAQPGSHQLRELLAALAGVPQVLLIFNHPMWDLPKVGRNEHRRATRDLLSIANPFLHAFEIGGLRGWRENYETIELARAYDKPFIAGGDRHGCEPSGFLNLTNAASFSEFVDEVRQGHSHVLAMPQYGECTTLRVYHTLLDVIRYYPDHPMGTRNWDERVFHPDARGVPRPVGMLWSGTPPFIDIVINTLRMGEAEPIHRALQFTFNRNQQTPKVDLEAGQEASL